MRSAQYVDKEVDISKSSLFPGEHGYVIYATYIAFSSPGKRVGWVLGMVLPIALFVHVFVPQSTRPTFQVLRTCRQTSHRVELKCDGRNKGFDCYIVNVGSMHLKCYFLTITGISPVFLTVEKNDTKGCFIQCPHHYIFGSLLGDISWKKLIRFSCALHKRN